MPAPGDGPSAAQRARSFFRYQLVGRVGGLRPGAGADGADGAAPTAAVATVVGGDPGYDETAKMVSEAALCLARDAEEVRAGLGVACAWGLGGGEGRSSALTRPQLPSRAGFLTPAAGLGMRYATRLREAGIGIEVADRA